MGSLCRFRLFSCFALTFVILAWAATGFPVSAQTSGQWSSVQTLPYRPVFAQLLPTGKLLFYSYYGEAMTPQIWDPVQDSVAPAATIGYSIFCSGNNFLADGRLFVAGGHEADYVGYAHASIYNPYTDTWTSAPDMNAGRWYPTATTLANGDVLVLSGDINSNTNVDPLPQVYQAAINTWRDLTSAQLNLALYPRALLAPNGKVFTAGPESTTRYLDTSGTGAWSTVGKTLFTSERDYGSAVMYDVGKVLIVGGGDPPTNTAEIIDLNSGTPVWKATGSMNYARRQLNATVLPDGEVLITGGSSGSGFDNANTPVYPAEMWDPATGAFTVMAANSIYRGYHSTAILLPDGTVFAGGGNVGGPNYEIFSPPYLSAGPRPTISFAPSGADYGQPFVLKTPDAATVAQVSLIRLGAVTHSFDMSQRFMRLSFTQGTGGLNVTAPSDPNVAPPGYYMLFLLSGNGVPSIASIIQIGNGSSSGTGAVSGTVTDANGQPLSGATVLYNGGIGHSDGNGNFTLTNVPAGTVALTASMAGYQSQTQNVTVTAGASTTAPPFQLVTVQTGSITGLVTNATGSPLGGVIVAYGGGSTTTDSTGKYTLPNVPAAQVTITASLTGYQSATATISVSANATTTAPTFMLSTTPTGTITGNVVNASGAAVVGATVAYGGASTVTDAAGNYSLFNVPAGTVLVAVTATGYQSATQNVLVTTGTTVTANFALVVLEGGSGTINGIVTDINNGQPLLGASVTYSGGSTLTDGSGRYTFSGLPVGSYSFTAKTNGYLPRSAAVTVTNGVTTELDIPISTAGQISGTVTNSSGQAVAGAAVQIQGGKLATNITVNSNASGNYISGWVPIGSYTLAASGSGYATQSATTTVTSGVTSRVNFTLASGSSSTGTITGIVTDTSGLAIPGATVSYAGGATTTGSNGSYQFTGIAAGTYSMTAQASGYSPSTLPATVTAGQTATLNFTLSATSTGGGGSGTLSGTVVDISSNHVIAGATVSYSGGSTVTASNGAYQFTNVPAGTYSVTAKASGYFALAQPATVNSGAATTLNFSLATGGILAGTVKNSSGAAVAGAAVTATGGKVPTNITVTTNSSGAYNTSWVSVGSYTISVSASGFATQSQAATVSTGVTTTVNFALSTGSGTGTGTLNGLVLDGSTNLTIAGASVTFAGGSTSTSANGSYQFTTVAAGAYSVTAQASGYLASTQSVTVTAGQTSTLNLTLTPTSTGGGGGSGTLRGTVLDISTNQPIAGAAVSYSAGSATTASNGAYQFSSVAAGTYNVTANASGYFVQTKSATVNSGAATTLNFSLATGGKLAGTVKNSSGAAVSGLGVTAIGGKIATTVTVTTNSSGAYNTGWLPVGTYTMTVSASGHATQSKSATANTGLTTTVNFTNF